MLTFHFFCNFVDRITLQNFRKSDFLLFQHSQIFDTHQHTIELTCCNDSEFYWPFVLYKYSMFFQKIYNHMSLYWKDKKINFGNTKNMSSNDYWKINEIRFYLICSKESFACITLKSKNGSIHWLSRIW